MSGAGRPAVGGTRERARAAAFAPATVANVGVGFDILGFAIDGLGDRVTVSRTPFAGRVEIEGVAAPQGMDIPADPARNTATAGLLHLAEELAVPHGFRVRIEKGIPLGSGMGGSAASAVAGVVAANALLDRPLPREKLLHYALIGEAVASGSIHGDNVAPCLLGGLMLVRSVAEGAEDVVPLPVPAELRCVVVHPGFRLDTREARAALAPDVPLKRHVAQSANLAGLLAGLYRSDLALVGRSLADVLIEPQRARLIPGFEAVKRAALGAGALGCSISGAGPSVFAWVDSEAVAKRAKEEMSRAFEAAGAQSVRAWISPIRAAGAVIEE
ncbi:MAG: homoserine kinase [Oligoflexia bacterium]|nr:homoserine kinase [Oligoflexia bacterium]